ncbi:MAG: hypothetical protein U0031_19795 [Thermomicrobiales bacterium]
MDADRFDSLARQFVAPASRRTTLGAAAAGLLSVFAPRAVPAARAAAGEVCTLAFVASVRLGPSTAPAVIVDGQRPGEVRGELRFSLDNSGNLEDAALVLDSGEELPVVGQATGYALNARIEVAPRVAMVVVGVGEQEIAACQGAIDGVVTGPEPGDLGDWHAAVTAGETAQGATGKTGKGGKGGKKSGGQEQAAGAAAPKARPEGSGRGKQGQGQGQGQAQGQSSGQSSGGQQGGGKQGGRGTSDTSTSSNAPSCPSGETYCDYVTECRNLSTSPFDCGACGNRCSSTACQDGRCLSEEEADNLGKSCEQGQTFCNLEEGYCADLQTDALNCGACGQVCPTDTPMCIAGQCVAFQDDACSGSQILCNDVCVDPLTDADNCGACGNVCQSFPEIYNCENGVCVEPSCAPLTKCTFLCVDLPTDPLNCGACGVVCEEGTTCQNGVCSAMGGGGCVTGLVMCNGACVDQSADAANCGGCGNVCPEGTSCSVGACVSSGGGGCVTGLTGCGGICVDTSSDPANCGACGVACGEGMTCTGGACTPSGGGGCLEGLTDCGGGVCVDLLSDPFNCGGCGVVCPEGACAAGVCPTL